MTQGLPLAIKRKLGWVLLSPTEQPLPSTRIAALNMIEDLSAIGFASELLFAPSEATERPTLPPLETLLERVRSARLDAVVFQKVHGAPVVALAGALRAAGVKTVFLVCDLVEPEMSEATDLTVVVSPYLRSLYPEALRSKVKVVHDGIERPDLAKSDYSRHRGSRRQPLRAVLITSAQLYNLAELGLPPPWLRTEVVGNYPPLTSTASRLRAGLRKMRTLDGVRQRVDYLAFSAHPRVTTRNWSESAAYQALLAADIGVIAVDTQSCAAAGEYPPIWMRKSENRLTLKMSLGLPVIASPVPAYLDVIDHGVTGFIAHNAGEWRRYLEDLRSPELRFAVGTRARQAVSARFSRARQATELAHALTELLHGKTANR